jgi:hypothetical protein
MLRNIFVWLLGRLILIIAGRFKQLFIGLQSVKSNEVHMINKSSDVIWCY